MVDHLFACHLFSEQLPKYSNASSFSITGITDLLISIVLVLQFQTRLRNKGEELVVFLRQQSEQRIRNFK